MPDSRDGSERRTAGHENLQDNISRPMPPPAVGLMLPVSLNVQAANNASLTEQDQTSPQPTESRSFRDDSSQSGRITHEPSFHASSNLPAPSQGTKSNSDLIPTSSEGVEESSPLLGSASRHARRNSSGDLSFGKGEDEINDKAVTTWKKELWILTKYSVPLMLSCVLQYSLTGASVIAVGHLGKTELAAVSLAMMTSNVTGYCAYAGLATSLDTLCAQAYGSGKPRLVGLQFQRMVYFLWIITIPIALIWLSGTQILLLVTPDRKCAELAGLYLKILVLGAPGFAVFEAGKRFVQAQGLFNANFYVLLVCAPLNAFMNWLFVWVSKAADPQPKWTLTCVILSITTGALWELLLL
jgi:MatE